MADRPGVMLYLDLRPAISYLSDADKGRLLDAILAYAADGTPLDDADGTLAAIWALLQPRIDRDAEHYKLKCRKATYATYARRCKQHGHEPLSYIDWDLQTPDDVDLSATIYTSSSAERDTSASTDTAARARYDRYRRDAEANI